MFLFTQVLLSNTSVPNLMDSQTQMIKLATTSVFLILSFIFVYIVIVIWKRRSSATAKTSAVPEPVGAWPLIGHLPMLVQPNLPHLTLGTLADKYGPVFSINLGLQRVLVVSSSEVAKECFTTNDRIFATRPRALAIEIMGYNYAIFGSTPYGPYWREARKVAILELLSNRRLELLKHLWNSEVNTSIKELYRASQAKCGGPMEMKQWFAGLTLNTVVKMVAGKRYNPLVDDNDEGARLQNAVKEFFHLSGMFVLGDAVPSLRWLDFQGHEKAMRRTAKEVDSILSGWLEEHRQNKVAGGDGENVHQEDFMYVLLSILEDNKLHGFKADTVNKAICWNMIVAGADTTMVTMTWALSLLLNHRHILKKAQDEIDNNVGKGRQVEASDIEKLVYLQAIIKESMRLYPPAPLGAPHEATEDCTVAGYHVPAGTRLLTNVWKIQRDPSVYSNPSEFQPQRFLTTQAKVDAKGQHFELLPFGSGRRSCPGMSFALQVVHLTVARLLQGFDFNTPANAIVDMTESAGLTNLKATPLEVLITPRLHYDLY